MDRAEEHLGSERAERYLRKFYPWYMERWRPRPRSSRSSSAAPTSAAPGS